MGSERFEKMKLVLTKPLSIEDESSNDPGASNVLKGILNLVKDLKPGCDLTKLQLPSQFNIPKSYLQFCGEAIYSVSENVNMMERCNGGGTPVERLIQVIALNISNLRPWTFGLTPYNPILGETHHVSNGTLNVFLEMISHHPPVTALHATDEKERIQLIWCQNGAPKFCGRSVMFQLKGKRQLKLMKHRETYTSNSPNILFKFIPTQRVEWNGNEKIVCKESGLEADLNYGGTSLLGRTRAVKGKIFDSFSRKPLFEINGYWDKTVTVQDVNSKETRIIYNAKEVMSNLQTPIVVDAKGIAATESAAVWSDVSKGIISNDWENATTSKKAIEENQRKLLKERQLNDETWVPKHFIVSNSKEAGWECSPVREFVPKAPIVVPRYTL